MVISNNLSSETTISSFVVDTNLQRAITSATHCEALQADHDNVYTWTEDIGMIFIVGKLKLLQFWLDRDETSNILYMAPDGGPIVEKDCVRDWAIWVSIDLTFNNRIDIVVQSGNQMACWALHTFRRRGTG